MLKRRYQDFRRMFLDFYSREDLTRVSFSLKMAHFDKKWSKMPIFGQNLLILANMTFFFFQDLWLRMLLFELG